MGNKKNIKSMQKLITIGFFTATMIVGIFAIVPSASANSLIDYADYTLKPTHCMIDTSLVFYTQYITYHNNMVEKVTPLELKSREESLEVEDWSFAEVYQMERTFGPVFSGTPEDWYEEHQIEGQKMTATSQIEFTLPEGKKIKKAFVSFYKDEKEGQIQWQDVELLSYPQSLQYPRLTPEEYFKLGLSSDDFLIFEIKDIEGKEGGKLVVTLQIDPYVITEPFPKFAYPHNPRYRYEYRQFGDVTVIPHLYLWVEQIGVEIGTPSSKEEIVKGTDVYISGTARGVDHVDIYVLREETGQEFKKGTAIEWGHWTWSYEWIYIEEFLFYFYWDTSGTPPGNYKIIAKGMDECGIEELCSDEVDVEIVGCSCQELPNGKSHGADIKSKGIITRASPDFYSLLIYYDNPKIIFKCTDDKRPDADHLMQRSLIVPLEKLVELVDQEWGGNIKLRITEAWDEEMEHCCPSPRCPHRCSDPSAYSAHYEGRALDLTVTSTSGTPTNEDIENYPCLGCLAIQAGFDYVLNEGNHIHVTEDGEHISSLQALAYSPVDLIITDPDGFIIAPRISEIPGATYTEIDVNGDGDPDDLISFPEREIGEYLIEVIPEPDADPTDTYTLEVSAEGKTIVLAENVPIGEIPSQPYIIKSTETTVIQIIPATIDFHPGTLNLKSKGKWVTTYIELPEDYDASNIDVSTIRLNDEVQAEANPTEIGDYGGDGIADLMVKFDRSAVQEILEVGDEVKITVAGELTDGTPFEGSDTIRVIDKGKGK